MSLSCTRFIVEDSSLSKASASKTPLESLPKLLKLLLIYCAMARKAACEIGTAWRPEKSEEDGHQYTVEIQ